VRRQYLNSLVVATPHGISSSVFSSARIVSRGRCLLPFHPMNYGAKPPLLAFLVGKYRINLHIKPRLYRGNGRIGVVLNEV
jgi:hypothetical protein